MTSASFEIVPEIRLGGMLMSLTDVVPGFEQAYYRWYERDHFYSGMLLGPNTFSGRRWIATRPLKDARFPLPNSVIEDITSGSFLHTYWVVDGKLDETMIWSVTQVHKLYAQDRMGVPRRNINTGYYRYDWGILRDEDGVPPELALEHPYAGVCVLVFEHKQDIREPGRQEALRAAVKAALVGEVALVLSFQPVAWPKGIPSNIEPVSGTVLRQRSVMLAFLDQTPTGGIPKGILALGQNAAGCQLSYVAPFIPTIPGTDTYIDQI